MFGHTLKNRTTMIQFHNGGNVPLRLGSTRNLLHVLNLVRSKYRFQAVAQMFANLNFFLFINPAIDAIYSFP